MPPELDAKLHNSSINKQSANIVSGKTDTLSPTRKNTLQVKPTKKPGSYLKGSLGGIANASKKDPIKVAEQIKDKRKKKLTIKQIKEAGQLKKAIPSFKKKPIHNFDLPYVDASKTNLVHSTYHGMGSGLNKTPDQISLIHGLDMNNKTLITGTSTKGAFFSQNPISGHHVIVKPSSGTLAADKGVERSPLETKMIQDRFGHFAPDAYNAARREIVYHNMARDLFKIPHVVPVTAGFTKHGEDYSVQKLVEGTPSNELPKQDYHDALNQAYSTGDLHKMAIMDFLMGHNDRHRGNVLIDKNKQMHLIDNGLSSDYEHQVTTTDGVPKYLRDHDDLMGQNAKIHPEAQKWLQELDPKTAVRHWVSQGFSRRSPQVMHFLKRLDDLKTYVPLHSGSLSSLLGLLSPVGEEKTGKRPAPKIKEAAATTIVTTNS